MEVLFGVLLFIGMWAALITIVVKLLKAAKNKVKEFSQSGIGERMVSASKNFVVEVTNSNSSNVTQPKNIVEYDLSTERQPTPIVSPYKHEEPKNTFVTSKPLSQTKEMDDLSVSSKSQTNYKKGRI